MACDQVLGRLPFLITVTSTTEVPALLGRTIGIAGGKELDFALTIDRVTGNAVAIPATALMTARPDKVDSVTAASGTFQGAQGATHHATNLSAVTNKFFAQPAVLAKLSSGTTPGTISGFLSVVLRACAQPIGGREVEVSPFQTFAAPTITLLGRAPASGADKLRAALVANAINNIEYLFLVRGVNDPEAPGSWSSLGTWTALAQGASAICTTDESVSPVTPTNFHFLEFALSLRLKSGTSAPEGFVRVSAALSYT